jgi:hypothetical protein
MRALVTTHEWTHPSTERNPPADAASGASGLMTSESATTATISVLMATRMDVKLLAS